MVPLEETVEDSDNITYNNDTVKKHCEDCGSDQNKTF